jgi:hypothetical protein
MKLPRQAPWKKQRVRPRDGRRIRGAALESMIGAHRLYLVRQKKLMNPEIPNPIPASGKRAEFAHADLRGVNFSGRDLSDADFSFADLREADFTGAHIQRADLTGADFRGAKGLTVYMIQTAYCVRTILPDDVYKALPARFRGEEWEVLYRNPEMVEPRVEQRPQPDQATATPGRVTPG